MLPLRFGPMANDAPVPRGFWATIRWIFDNFHWIFLLVSIERLADGHNKTAFVFFAIFVLAIFVAPRWETIANLVTNLVPKTRLQSSKISISDGMYIGEINFDLNKIKEDRYIEIVIRVFNGTGSTVALEGVKGAIRYHEMSAGKQFGDMPTPTVRTDTSRTVLPGKEWSIILAQHAPAAIADEICTLVAPESGKSTEFDFWSQELRMLLR
jgi:hypothetical protein